MGFLESLSLRPSSQSLGSLWLSGLCGPYTWLPGFRAPKDYINIRILRTMVSGIPLILGLGTRMSDPCVYVVFWALMMGGTP